MNALETRVLSLIRKGRDNARRSNVIADFLNVSERKIRRVIRELIAQGNTILSATEEPAGYFIATTWKEVMHCADVLKARGVDILVRRRDILRAARDKVPPEQLELIAK